MPVRPLRRNGRALAVAATLAALLLPELAVLPALASTIQYGCIEAADVVTCTYTIALADNRFSVPAGVTSVHAVVVGGAGAGRPLVDGSAGGRGAIVTGDLAVTPGDVLLAKVGGNAQLWSGGLNGGGNGDAGCQAGGGGGASDIRASSGLVQSRRLVAAGGGGAGCNTNGAGDGSTDGGDAGMPGHPGSFASPNVNGGAGRAGCADLLFPCTNGGSAGVGDYENGSGGASSGIEPAGGVGGPGYAGIGVSDTGGGGGGGGGWSGGGGGGGGGYGLVAGDIGEGSGGGGGGGSSYTGGATNASVALDDTGIPSITISYTPPGFNVESASSTGTTSVTVTFDAPPDAAQAATLANYSVPGLTLAGAPSLVGTTVTIATSTQAAQPYLVTVSNVTRASDAEPLTVDSAGFTGTAAGTLPVASVSPASLSFGNVRVGVESTAQEVTVSADSNGGSLHLDQLATVGTNANDFVLGSDTCSAATLAPGTSCTLEVTFLPAARGVRSATLRVPDDAADSPQDVALSGTGVAPIAQVSPASIDFGTMSVGTTSGHRTVTVTNVGDAGQNLVLSSETITGANASDFAFAGDTCITQFIAAGSSCTIDLTFTPGAAGARSATLTISDNGLASPHTVSLSGTGGTPTADLAVSISASLSKVKGASAVTYTITVLNAGPATAAAILINDSLSSQTTFVSAAISNGTCVTPVAGASGVVSCSLASLSSGSSSPVQIVVTVIARRTSITNTVTISASTSDPNLANNTAAITVRVK
jgi:uncharacterized repeat protein (TIGR01451 family)